MRRESSAGMPLIGIVDDDEAVGASIDSLLRSAGFSTAAFSSPEAFLDSDYVNAMECVILDVRMPRVNGFQVQEHLARLGSPMRVIFATGSTDEDVRKRALGSGAVAFLQKPFGEEALFAAMRLALAK